MLLDSNAPSKIKIKDRLFAHLETWRLYTVIWSGLVSLTGACIAYQDLPPTNIALLALFIPMMGWTAALYLSDYLDGKLDAIEKPHRPIPSGRIKPLEALVIGAIFAIAGLGLSFLLSIYNIILVFVVALLVFGYAKFFKSHGIFGNINRGLPTVAAYLFGVFSINPSIESLPNYIWLISLVFLFHDTNSNLVGAIRDMEGDKKGGYRTVPVKYGLKTSIIVSFILTVMWLSLTLYLAYYYDFLKTEFYMMMILDIIILITLYVYLIRSIKAYSREKALRFHEIFVIERVTLASAIIIGVIDNRLAITIYVTALIITVLSQIILRKRYEFEMEK